jgi:hypothetical protein
VTAARWATLAVFLLVAPRPAAAQTETIEYYGLDALGSVRVIVDAQGNPIDRMDYGPFGENLKASIKMAFEQSRNWRAMRKRGRITRRRGATHPRRAGSIGSILRTPDCSIPSSGIVTVTPRTRR